MSLVANIGVLAYFKYYNFFIDTINEGLGSNLSFLSIVLPIGLSFHTFQAMSYTIEVYRGHQKAERHFGIYSLYVMFYPQLVAGPIERPQNVIHQFYEKKEFSYTNTVSGLRLMMLGLFKKVVIADRIAALINPVYATPQDFSSIAIAIAVLFFAFQIYCDFSGYSDIAIGAARVMGYDLMINFNRPFSSKSITEFWRRWHISLSTWFNDYVFTPVITALRDWGNWAIAFGLMLTFFLSGFWHGAGWQFILYGLMHGVALVYEFRTRKWRKKTFKRIPQGLNNAISMILTVGYVALSWIFFRAETVKDAFYIFKRLPGVGREAIQVLTGGHLVFVKYITGMSLYAIISCLLLIGVLELIHRIQKNTTLDEYLQAKPLFLRMVIYYGFSFAIIYFGVFNNTDFIYFQF